MEWETVTTVPGGILTGMGGTRGDLTRTKIFRDTGVVIKGGGTLLDMRTGKISSEEVEGRDFIMIDRVLEWVAREPEGHTTLEEAINSFYGLEDIQESPYIEDSYLMQDEEWEEEAWENDRFRFLEELMDDDDFDRYQLTWSDEDDIFHYYEDDEWEGEEIDLVSEEIKDNFFHEKGESIPGIPIVDYEEKLVSLEPEKERSRLACPSKNRGWLELLFYNKHTLYPILEEGTNWDKPDEGVENLKLIEANGINIWNNLKQEEDHLRDHLIKGQELNNKQLVFGMLEEWERKEEIVLERIGQYECLLIQLMGQRGHLDWGSKKGEWFSSGKLGRKARIDWKWGKEIHGYLEVFDPGGSTPFGEQLVTVVCEFENFEGIPESYLSIVWIMCCDIIEFELLEKLVEIFLELVKYLTNTV